MVASSTPAPKRPWVGSRLMRWVRTYMGYSRTEVRGLTVLLLIIMGAIVLPILLRPDLPVYLPASDQKGLDELVAKLKEHRISARNFASRYPKREAGKPSFGNSKYPQVARVALAPFDPNALTPEGWEARGVPHFVASRMVKYRDMAGGFKAKAQVKKMYGLADSVYQRLAPFMQLPDEAPKRGERPSYAANAPGKDGKFPPFAAAGTTASKFPSKPKNLRPFDLNTADTTQLMQIRGIGAGRAKAVVKLRNQLGGYVREEQLSEIFILKDAPDLVDSLRKYTFVATGFAPQLMAINAASFDEMYLHPYIRKALARAIVAYRNQHGPYKSIEDLKKVPLLKAEEVEKLRPYLRFE